MERKNIYDILMVVSAIFLVFPVAKNTAASVLGRKGGDFATPVAVVVVLVYLKVVSDLLHKLDAEGKL